LTRCAARTAVFTAIAAALEDYEAVCLAALLPHQFKRTD
jgi:hypothetical protein